MKRGGGYGRHDYTLSPFEFFVIQGNLIQYPFPEVFIDLNYNLHPEIKPMYMISNHGRLFHKFLGEILNINIDSKGYSYKPLATFNGARNYRLHRLVMEAFNYIDGCDELLINHIDGNKTNNLITNLEWCTYSENAQHAYNNNMISRVHKSKYDKDIIRNICKMLENPDISITDIAKVNKVSTDLVNSILYGRAHNIIASEYNIAPRNNKPPTLSDEQVGRICEFFQLHSPRQDMSKQYYRDALSYAGINDHSKSLLDITYSVYARKSYKRISNNYIF